MMTDPHATARPPRLLVPRHGDTVPTLLEAALGCALLMGLARLLDLFGGGVIAGLPLFLSVLWLIVWPAWKLRPIEHRRWWARIGLGLLRAVAVGALLVLVGTTLSTVITGYHPAWNGWLSILFWFLVLRAMIVGGAVVARRVRRRFRWQLIVSHVAIIVLMFVTLTFGGSVLGLVVATHFIASHPLDMAASVRDDLQLARALSPVNQRRTREVFRLIYLGRLPLRGGSPLIAFVRSPLLPNSLGLVAPDGHVFQGTVSLGRDGKQTRPASSWADLVRLSPARAEHLRQIALSGRVGQEQVQSVNVPETVTVMPIRGPNRAVTAMLVLRVTDFQPTQHQFFEVLVAIVGVTTIGLIVITAIPMLGLSFLFSYVVARGLTRRLESLSEVATSIASGNLAKRAPITTRNEVGRLAGDVNQMADHLQTTIRELEAARAESEEALRLRQELVANISHELRTPLATMRAHLDTVTVRDSVPAGTAPVGGQGEVTVPAPTLEALQAETGRLEALVDDLFALSRAQAGAIEMRLESVDVSALVEEIAALMRPLA